MLPLFGSSCWLVRKPVCSLQSLTLPYPLWRSLSRSIGLSFVILTASHPDLTFVSILEVSIVASCGVPFACPGSLSS